jgi:hypothetical protein
VPENRSVAKVPLHPGVQGESDCRDFPARLTIQSLSRLLHLARLPVSAANFRFENIASEVLALHSYTKFSI